ncbi:MAG: HTH domain-containing protein, partial [Ignavibacteriaceae bacterium]|nr:HTH domain-containing protein [Ignavibacteriaceae bacterium]
TGGQASKYRLPTKRQLQVMLLINNNVFISRNELAKILGINESAVQKHIEILKNKRLIERVGGTFGGQWKILVNIDRINSN